MTNDDKHTSGFLSGMMFGLMAGASSYFFFKTDEGKKARQKLVEEWEKAKGDLVESGVIEDASKSLPETLRHTIQRIVDPKKTRKVARKTEELIEAGEEIVNKTTKKAKSTAKKFKGTK